MHVRACHFTTKYISPMKPKCSLSGTPVPVTASILYLFTLHSKDLIQNAHEEI